MDFDEFSDDGFDDIPADALQELENHAIQFTQAQQIIPAQNTKDSEYAWDGEEEDDDLDTTEVTNDAGLPVGRPPGSKAPTQSERPAPAIRQVPGRVNPHWNPSIDISRRQDAAQASSASGQPNRQRLPPAASGIPGSQRFQPSATPVRPTGSQFARPPLPQHQIAASQASQGPPGDIVSALQQRLRVLEGELNVARGEAAILRSNSTKFQQNHDAEVSRLKKLSAEQTAKQERLVEAAVAAEKTASTELQFLQRDLKEVNDRARRKDHVGTVTPKKTNKTWGFADGFDEVDKFPSPSKTAGKGRTTGGFAANAGERTPSKGKRKRPTVDSPVMALETHTGDGDALMADAAKRSPVPINLPHPTSAPPFEFLPLVLDHGTFRDDPPTFDLFSRFCFPSDPSTSFSTIIFQKLPLMGDPHQPMQLLVDFCELVVSMWARCFDERYWEPVKHLVSLICFTLYLHTTTIAVWTFKNLATTAQTTIFMLAEGRHRVADGDLSKNEAYNGVEEHVDTARILALLQLVAMACATTPIKTDGGQEFRTADLWQLLTLDFVLLLLTPKQRFEDVIGVLGLLSTSVLPASIGPIVEDKEPAFVARVVIERVSAKLVEFPISVTTQDERRRIRTAALRTMIAFSRHQFGALQLASHSNALPRLVTCLSTSIDSLYDQQIPASILPAQDDSQPIIDGSASLCRIISQCVMLLHFLITSPETANTADIAQKLSVSLAGSQRYLIALGRLTFAEEDLVLESGLDSEVLEAAHELLELAVTPDEGELVSAAFGA